MYEPARAPLLSTALLVAALTSWTCTNDPAVQADVPDPARSAASTGDEAPLDPWAGSEQAGELEDAEPAPPEIVDEGIPGLRMPVHDPSGRALEGLHAALRRAQAGEGQARIMVYGASHIAADFTTGYLRRELQSRFGDAGHGFMLPVHPWRSYRHRSAQIESNRRFWTPLRVRVGHTHIDHYGLAGVAVETTRAHAWGRVTTAARGEVGRKTSRYDLYYLKQPGGGNLDVLIDGRRRSRIRTRADEIQSGYATYEVDDGSHQFEVRARGGGPVRLFGVVLERDRPGVVVDTLGINGARARYHLLWEDALYREHLARRSPDLVALAYGTNEAGDDDVSLETYEERVRQVVSRVREVVPQASCLLIGPSDRPLRDRDAGTVEDRPRTMQLVEVQRRVSVEHGCAFFDLVQFMGGPLGMVQWVQHDPPYGAPDHIHFTRRGYERLGEVLFSALLHGYGDLPERGAALVEPAEEPESEPESQPENTPENEPAVEPEPAQPAG